MSKLLFKELQKANLGWKWALFIILYALMFWALYEQIQVKDLTGILAITFSTLVIIIFNVIIVSMNLETEIDENIISFRFKPFHKKQRTIKLDEIRKLYIRTYKPLKEYGGYGIQKSLRNGKAYHLKGKTGIQIILKDNKKILIGTQKPKEAERIINMIKK